MRVIAGDGPPPSLVLELTLLLPAGSACEAIRHEAPEMLGYGIGERILLNVSDWTQQAMRASGQWEKGKVPKFVPEIRPWAEAQKKADKKKTREEGVEIHHLFSLMAARAAGQ